MSPKTPHDGERCMKTDAAGRRCRSRRLPGGDHTLCYFHFNRASRPASAARRLHPLLVAHQLLPADQQLRSAESVNEYLTRVLRQLAEGNLSSKQASTLAYLGQLIISTLPHMQREAAAQPAHPLFPANPEAAIEDLARTLQSLLTRDADLPPANAQEAAVPPERANETSEENFVEM